MSAAGRANFTSRNFANNGNLSNRAFGANSNVMGKGALANNHNFSGNNFYGRGGYGGWGGYGGYGFFPGFGLFGLGLGLGLGGYGGYGGYGYGNSNYGYGSGNSAYAAQTTAAGANTEDYTTQGEQAFQAGQYQNAIRDWQHSLVDGPHGGVLLMMSQALFAVGQYEASANTVQMAMQMLPENEWGNVVKNYTQLYPNIQNYTDQLKSLEQARDAKPDDPALRFLLGYHFGYLGYPKQATRELDKALDLQPQDLGSQKLRDLFAVQASLPARAHPAAPDQAPGSAPPTTGAPAPLPTDANLPLK
jgi:tetratricopeptide (TPR) repeat protein